MAKRHAHFYEYKGKVLVQGVMRSHYVCECGSELFT